jgi:hypothetical protein
MSKVKSGIEYIDANRIRNSGPLDIAISFIIIHLLMAVAAEGLDVPGCKFLSCW